MYFHSFFFFSLSFSVLIVIVSSSEVGNEGENEKRGRESMEFSKVFLSSSFLMVINSCDQSHKKTYGMFYLWVT